MHIKESAILARVNADPNNLDPRVRKSREAVLSSAVALFVAGGPRSVTVEAVSESSGVAKTTIYRHWNDRAHLLADTYRACLPVMNHPESSLSPQDGLREVVQSLVLGMGSYPTRQALPHLIATPLDPVESEALPPEILDQTFAPLVRAIEGCVTSGLIAGDTDIAEAKHQLVGFIVMSALDAECRMDEALANRAIDLFLNSR